MPNVSVEKVIPRCSRRWWWKLDRTNSRDRDGLVQTVQVLGLSNEVAAPSPCVRNGHASHQLVKRPYTVLLDTNKVLNRNAARLLCIGTRSAVSGMVHVEAQLRDALPRTLWVGFDRLLLGTTIHYIRST